MATSEGTWACSACTLLNPPSAQSCTLCTTPRPSTGKLVLPKLSSSSKSSLLTNSRPIPTKKDKGKEKEKEKERRPSSPLHGAPSKKVALDLDSDHQPAVAEAYFDDATGEWPKALGDVIVLAYSTRSGKDLIAPGDAVTISRPTAASASLSAAAMSARPGDSSSKSGGSSVPTTTSSSSSGSSSGSSHWKSKKDDAGFIRFACKGTEIGRLPTEVSRWLGPVLDAGIVTVQGVCVDAPASLRAMDQCILQLTLSGVYPAFCTRHETHLTESVDEDERTLALRTALAELLTTVGLDINMRVPRRTSTAAAGGTDGDGTGADGDEDGGDDVRDLQFICERMVRADADLPQMEPAPSVASTLRAYQKQALHWMSERENLSSQSIKTAEQLHPLWVQLTFKDGTPFYWHTCSGALTIHFPCAAKQARGGILADAMGLGKTIETLALIATQPAPPAFAEASFLGKTALSPAQSPLSVADAQSSGKKAAARRGLKALASAGATNIDTTSSSPSPGQAQAPRSRRQSSSSRASFSPVPMTVEEEEGEGEEKGRANGSSTRMDTEEDNTKGSASADEDPDFIIIDTPPQSQRPRPRGRPPKDKGRAKEEGAKDTGRESTRDSPRSLEQFLGDVVVPASRSAASISTTSPAPAAAASSTSPSRGDGRGLPHSCATLVVCPMSLLAQWEQEARTHIKGVSVMAFYGTERDRSLAQWRTKYDIILTTYGTLSAEYTLQSEGKGVSPLFSMYFWRVLLDEAHTIKSRSTLVAKACYAVEADRRWAITGTPIQNKLEDVFSLIRFLRVEPWCMFPHWREHIQLPFEENEAKGIDTLQRVLQPMLLRRTKNTKDSDGRPILTLPSSNVAIVPIELTPAEREFYQAVYTRSKTFFKQFQASGKVMSNYANILELLLRLRQACDHPFLTMKAGPGNTRSFSLVGHTFDDIDALLAKFVAESKASGTGAISESFAHSVAEELRSALGDGGSDGEGGGANGEGEGESESGAPASQGARAAARECPICLEVPDTPVLTPCAHIGCEECFATVIDSLHFCPVCRKPVECEQLAKIVKKAQVKQEERAVSDEDVKDFKPSSKIVALMKEVKAMLAQDDLNKCIIFSQFTSMLDLVQTAFALESIKVVRLDGSLSHEKRTQALQAFKDDPSIRIFLISLKSGGVGLNLTAASHVILVDPWWNPAVEEQAIDRVHRIGQKRDVTVKRLIVTDSVEERILELQKRKRNLVHDALSRSEEERKEERLSDLKLLFGL